MKVALIVAAMLALGSAAPQASAMAAEKTQKEVASNIETVVIDCEVECQNCKKKIEKQLQFEKGVKDMEVSIEKQTVTVTFRNDKTSVEKLLASINKLGYKAQVKK